MPSMVTYISSKMDNQKKLSATIVQDSFILFGSDLVLCQLIPPSTYEGKYMKKQVYTRLTIKLVPTMK